jgi:hypothetical protein
MAYRPGLETPETGTYRCSNCGRETSLSTGDKFPPCTCGDADWEIRREEAETHARDLPRKKFETDA